MQQLLPPCPECGGTRALFKHTVGGHAHPAIILGFLDQVKIYACTCLNCGHTTFRVAPEDLGDIRDAARR